MKQIANTFDFGDWLSEYKTHLIAGAAALIILAGLLWNTFATGANENDYLTAANNFAIFKKSISNPKSTKEETFAALDKLDAQLKSFPEMREKYDGSISQLLLAKSYNDRALPYARRFLKRAQPNVLEAYHLFGEQTVELAAGNSEKAVEIAQNLAKTSKQDSLLHAFNTLQLALIEKSPQQWEDLKAALGEPGFQELNTIFSLGNINLIQFIRSQAKP